MNKVQVHKGRYNELQVNFQIDITGDTITSEIRERPNKSADLIATWDVTVTDASTGLLTIVIDDTADDEITTEKTIGYMDFKRVTGGAEVPVLIRPLDVEIIGSVTA